MEDCRARGCEKDHQQIISDRIVISDEGCWEWALYRSTPGYGTLSHLGRKYSAHRFAYTAFVGPIPEGLELDHLCRNRACCNPAHLEPVTHLENVRRGQAPTTVIARLGLYQPVKRPPLEPDDPRHGTTNGYLNRKCRCQPCRDAWADYHLSYRRTGRHRAAA